MQTGPPNAGPLDVGQRDNPSEQPEVRGSNIEFYTGQPLTLRDNATHERKSPGPEPESQIKKAGMGLPPREMSTVNQMEARTARDMLFNPHQERVLTQQAQIQRKQNRTIDR